jgi:hypothetical protein
MSGQRDRRAGLLALILLLVGSVTLAAGSSVYAVPWSALSSGAMRAAAGSYTLESTVGQAAAGLSNADGLDLCAGYQCAPPGAQVYLPVLLKNE